MKIPYLPHEWLIGVLGLVACSVAAFNHAVYILSGIVLIPVPGFTGLDGSVVAFAIAAGFAVSVFLLLRSKPGANYPSPDAREMLRKMGGGNTPEYRAPEPAAPPPQKPQDTSLEGLLGSAMSKGLSADLNFTLKLPPKTKLNILGQEWVVKDASIVISKDPTPTPTKPLEKPDDGMTPEERKYYRGGV